MTKMNNKYGYSGEPQFKPISSWGYFWYTVLFCIPVIGFLMLIIFALSKKNINRRNFARSFFCALLMCIIVFAATMVLGTVNNGKLLKDFFASGNPVISQINSIVDNVIPGRGTRVLTDWAAGETVTVELGGKSVVVHQQFKKTMDEYKSAYDEYIKVIENPSSAQYLKVLARFNSVSQSIDAIDESKLTDGDYAYYVYIMSQINHNLIQAAGK